MASKQRLIDANYALQQIEVGERENGGSFLTDSSHMKDFLNALPTVDAVEVVRRKDCKWYQIRKWSDETPKYDCRKTHALLDVNPNDFCSYGERKDNDCR